MSSAHTPPYSILHPVHAVKVWLSRKPDWFSFVVLWLVACITFTGNILRTESFVWGDAYYYYSYTRSIVIDQDIHFANEYFDPAFNLKYDKIYVPQTGYYANNFSPGTSLLWLPGFLLGQAISAICQWAGLPVTTTGFSWVTGVTTGWTAVGFSMFGCWVLFHLLTQIWSKTVATITVGTLLLTTQLFFYTFLDPFNSHSASFMLASIVCWCAYQLTQTDQPTWKLITLTGLALGYLGLIRNQDLLISAPIAIVVLGLAHHKGRAIGQVAVMAFLAALLVAVQVWFTWIIFNAFGSPYLIMGQKFSWLHPDVIRVLFTQGNGFFRYAPIAVVGLIGLVRWFKHDKVMASLGLAAFIGQLYVVAAWVPEIVGGPYGSRMFTSTLPWLGLGLAWVIDYICRLPDPYGPPIRRLSIITVLLLFGWNCAQILIMYLTW